MSTDDTRKLPDGFDIILARLDSFEQNMTTRMDGLNARMDGFEKRMDSFEARLTSLEEKVDRQSKETRPIWERALAEIADTRSEMRERFERIESEVKDTNRRMRVLNDHILDLAGDQRGFEERLGKLEGPHQ